MVMYTVNDAAGIYRLDDTPAVTKVLTQIASTGETDYLFTSSNIYNASMFAVRHADGDWLQSLFFGRTTIGPDGKIGFISDAQVTGTVGQTTADAFAVAYVTRHGSNEGLTAALFKGDDTLIGNSSGGSMSGWAGDDLIVGIGGGASFDGGAGDDVIDGRDQSSYTFTAIGGPDADFIFIDPNIQAYGGAGDDTFYFTRGATAKGVRAQLPDFAETDRIQFDPAVYKSLADGFSEDNFVAGPKAVDADDYILFYGGHLLYDPDGNGTRGTKALADLSPIATLTWRNIVISAAIPEAGDHGSATLPTHDNAHALGLHTAIHATGLLP